MPLLASAQITIHVPADQPSIQAAIDAAQDRDTVLVAPGTYRENVDFKGKSITLTSGAASYNDAGTVILQGDGRTAVVTIQGDTSVRGTLNGFTIQGGGNDDVTLLTCGGVADVGAPLTITNSIVTANSRCGVGAISGANLVVTGSVLRSNAGSAVLLSAVGDVVLQSNIIEGNVVPDIMQSVETRGAGILVLSGDTILDLAANSLLLDHNIIRNNTADIDPAFAMEIGVVIKNLTMVNNAFYGNVERHHSGNQIYLSGGSQTPLQPIRSSLVEINNTIVGGGQFLIFDFAGDSVIANSLFYNTNPLLGSFQFPNFAGLSCDDPNPSLPINVRYNDIYNIGKQIVGGCRLDTNNLAVEPQVRDIAADVREQPSSPLSGAGDLTAPLIPAADLDNKARTVCGKIDMGAYQHHPSPPIALTASADPSPGGNSVTFTAQLTGNCNVPTGVVTFDDGATPLGTGTLNGGAATSLTTAFLVVGEHTITAHYPGDFNFEESVSNGVTETVTGFATATTLTVAPSPATAFQPIALTATVTAAYGMPPGTVTFLANGNAVGTATLNGNGVATGSVRTLGAGTYNVVAVFNATTQYASSRSATVVEVVLGAPSTTTLRADPNPIYQGQTVTFTAGVSGAGGAAGTGMVQFLDGGALLGTAMVQGGGASFATSALAVGAHTMTASFLGGGDYAGSGSPAVVEIVLASSFGMAVMPGSVTVLGGQSAQATVTATSVGVYAGTLSLGHGALPKGMTLTFAPWTVALAAGGTASSTVTVNTGETLVAASNAGGWVVAAMVAPLLLWRRRLGAVLAGCVALGLLGAASGCGYSKTPYSTVAPGSYTIPLTATDAGAGTVASTTWTVTVTSR